MARRRTYHVSEVARIAGVSVRTLHHDDAIGLLVAERRTEAGYRVYNEKDLLRLQQVLIGREQGLALEDIRRSLDDPSFDRERALLAQKRHLRESAGRTAAMLRTVDAALAMLENDEGGSMDVKRLLEGFDPAEHQAETQDRWGDTETYRESARRAERYGEDDWRAVQEEQAAIYADAAEVLQAGGAADSTEAMAVAERHPQAIERWFYPCSAEMHVNLAGLWEVDARYAQAIDAYGPGLTGFLATAVRANARRDLG